MNEPALLSRYETADYCGYEFDYQTDFRQFLEEARKSACQGSLSTAAAGKELDVDWEKKKRRTWKSSLFSWLNRTDKKSKSSKQLMNATNLPKPRRGHVSGPVQGSISTTGRGRRRPTSGPLTGLFSSTKRAEEYEVPYVCLGQLDDPYKLHSYGPVYLVT